MFKKNFHSQGLSSALGKAFQIQALLKNSKDLHEACYMHVFSHSFIKVKLFLYSYSCIWIL